MDIVNNNNDNGSHGTYLGLMQIKTEIKTEDLEDSTHHEVNGDYSEWLEISNTEIKAEVKEEIAEASKPSGRKKITCKYCKKQYALQSTVDRHVKRHIKGYASCGLRHASKKKSQIKNEEQKVTTELTVNRFINCVICKKVFETNFELRHHVRQSHTPKEYKCNLCDRSFVVYSYFLLHVKKHSFTNFTCHKCDVEFGSESKLEQHLSDTDCAPASIAQCKVCKKSSRTRIDNNYFQRLARGKTLSRCNTCGR